MLSAALNAVGHISMGRSYNPVLNCVHLAVADGCLSVTASDGSTTATTKLAIPGAADDGEVIVSGRELIGIVSGLPDNRGDVAITVGTEAEILCGTSRYNLPIVNSSFPVLTADESPTCAELAIEPDLFRESINRALEFVSDGQGTHYTEGVHFEVGDGLLTVVTTNGFCLGVNELPAECIESDNPALLPGYAAKLLAKTLAACSQSISMRLSDGSIRITGGNTSMQLPLLALKFPDWRRVIPTEFSGYIDVDPKALLATMKRVLTMCDLVKYQERSHRHIIITGEGKLIVLSNYTTKRGFAADGVPCSINGFDKPPRIMLDPDALLKIINCLGCETIRISISSTGSSILITNPVSISARYVIQLIKE